MSISNVFPGLFNWVDIEQVRFSYTFTKSINESTKHVAHNTVYNYTKQQTEVCLTVDSDNVCKGRKHVHESKMQQPFGLFSMIFQDLALIPWLSRPWKFEFLIPWLLVTFQDPCAPCVNIRKFQQRAEIVSFVPVTVKEPLFHSTNRPRPLDQSQM